MRRLALLLLLSLTACATVRPSALPVRAELGLDVASREQQTPQGLAEFYKAEVDKWWPILKAANIKAE